MEFQDAAAACPSNLYSCTSILYAALQPIGGRTASKTTTTKNNHRTTKHTPTTIPMEQTETRNDPVEKEIKYISKINLLNRNFKCIKILSCFA